jgi:hypothetical protein
MIQSPTQAVTDAYQLISALDRALVAVYRNSDADFPMQDAAHDARAIEAWSAAAPDVRAVALVILGWDSRWENFPDPEHLLDFENPTEDGAPDGIEVLSEAGYFYQTAVDINEATTKDRTDYLGQDFPAEPLASDAGVRAALLTADGLVQDVGLKTALLLRTMAAANPDDISPAGYREG